MTITIYCSEISKREKQNFDHLSLNRNRGTHGVAENMTVFNRSHFMTLELSNNTEAELGAGIDRTKETRCIAICIPTWVFHIAMCFLAYPCTPYKYAFKLLPQLRSKPD